MKQLKPKNGERKFCSIIRTKQKKRGDNEITFFKDVFIFRQKARESQKAFYINEIEVIRKKINKQLTLEKKHLFN